ncbi:hypothetical protein G7067_03645 [Leucobacter insecticola]|uniref:Uncharacterized protein n=1 Tax=Leucobacter insecticola TaxID=2714934 RepID=A0A6G8FHE9_9MICO|nr:hypothetical protein [Leucobacter insecticola]QIM15713.1 hypothetical protein G7067_03645 [Leucobacter insecticola]
MEQITADSPPQSSPTLVALATLLEAGADAPNEDIAMIQHADQLTRRSRELLHELVVAAREHGTSWQSIGDALGISRQAAFKRFSTQHEGELMSSHTIDLIERTHQVFKDLGAENYEAVRAHMTYTCARALTKRKIRGVWSQVTADSGQLTGCVDSTAQTPDGANALSKFANRRLIAGTVVQTTLQHEAGEWLGRVAYNNSGKITGLLIAAPGSENLAF